MEQVWPWRSPLGSSDDDYYSGTSSSNSSTLSGGNHVGPDTISYRTQMAEASIDDFFRGPSGTETNRMVEFYDLDSELAVPSFVQGTPRVDSGLDLSLDAEKPSTDLARDDIAAVADAALSMIAQLKELLAAEKRQEPKPPIRSSKAEISRPTRPPPIPPRPSRMGSESCAMCSSCPTQTQHIPAPRSRSRIPSEPEFPASTRLSSIDEEHLYEEIPELGSRRPPSPPPRAPPPPPPRNQPATLPKAAAKPFFSRTSSRLSLTLPKFLRRSLGTLTRNKRKFAKASSLFSSPRPAVSEANLSGLECSWEPKESWRPEPRPIPRTRREAAEELFWTRTLDEARHRRLRETRAMSRSVDVLPMPGASLTPFATQV